MAIATYAADGQPDTLAARLTIRRQLRSMFNNTPLKLQSFYYIQYSDDPEQSGWYVPDFGQLVDIDGSVGLATGVWKLEQAVWLRAGTRRTNREARSIWMKDLRTGLYQRDYLGWIYSTDFSALPSLQLSVCPNGASQIANAVSGQVLAPAALPAGRDGGTCRLVSGLSDLAVVSYERAEAALNLSDTIVYDRRADAANAVEVPLTGNDISGWSVAAGAWLLAGATLAPDNTPAAIPQGSYAGKIVTTAATSQQGAQYQMALGTTFRAGVAYTFSVYLKGNAGGEAIRFGLGNTAASDSATSLATLTTGWQRFSVIWTPAADQTAVVAFLRSNGVAAYTFWANGVQVTQGSAATTFATAESGWEEVYGPDYPWSWLTAGQPNDVPVLDNGLVRVRYDASVGVPGFRVDVWNGAAYVEQGKMVVQRQGDVNGYCDTWVSAGLVEYTPDRAVVQVVLATSADTNSRERVFLIMQRGESSCRFEVYPAPKAAGTLADALLLWTPALSGGVGDLNNGVAKIDSQGSGSWVPGAAGSAVYAATAGTGAGAGNSGQFSVSNLILGTSNFSNSENWICVLRCPTTYNVIGAYQHTLVVQQGAGAQARYFGSSATAYGANSDAYYMQSQSAAGYLQVQVAFAPAQADQIMEAESMTLGTGTVTAAVASSSGTGNNATTSTRTTDTNFHVQRANWPNSFLATYRVFVRVKVSANTGSFYASTGFGSGAVVTTTSTSYVWLDLGEITANNTNFQIHAWIAAGGTVTVDRIEAVLVQDRARTAAIYSGARDAGQAALQDSRTLGTLVAR